MSNKSKFLPVLALAAVLAPFAASARSNPAPAQNPAHQQYLAGDFGDQRVAANVHGRAAQDHPSTGLSVLSSAQYAAVGTASDEN
jgi:hypothetical protein